MTGNWLFPLVNTAVLLYRFSSDKMQTDSDFEIKDNRYTAHFRSFDKPKNNENI